MYFYTAYGLNIRSSILLPELIAGGNGSDVEIHLGKVTLPSNQTCSAPCFHSTEKEVFLHWEEVGSFLVLQGREIVIDPAPGIEESILRLFILGSGLGVTIHQRGALVLHASAVTVHGGAAAFIGDKGWGKSTIAAALYRRGHSFITDDLVVLNWEEGHSQPNVYPGYPQFRLWADSFSSLGYSPEKLPKVRPELDKRYQRIGAGFSTKPLPLRSVYLLGGGDQVLVEPLPSKLAFIHLIRNLYGSRYGNNFLKKVGGAAYFSDCARLLKCVPIRLLRRPFDLSELSKMAKLVENDIQELSGLTQYEITEELSVS